MNPSNALSDLHARLLGPQADQARLAALQQLQSTRLRLQTQARQGFPSSRYPELEAAMAAVQAGIDILERLSVGSARELGNRFPQVHPVVRVTDGGA